MNMARETQIVPEKKYPFVETFYNDNSGWADTPQVAPIATGFNSMCVFASAKGIDNKLVTKYGTTEFLEEFGNVNFKAYGQPALNAYAMLETGNAIVHCMRVLPTDANYANTTILAKVKIATKEAEIAPVAVPTSLKAVATTTTTDITDEGAVTGTNSTYDITVTWDKHAEATSYELCINNETTNLITVTREEYVHAGLTAGNVYSYKVRAVAAEGTSAWSNVVELVAGAEGDEATVTAEDIANTTEVPDKMVIKFEAISTDALRTEDQIEINLEEMAAAAEVDDEGYLTVPLFTIYSLGRGIYGNNYALRIVDSLKMTEEYGTAMQQLELYDTETTFTIKERFYFSMDASKNYNGVSLFIGDVVSSPDEGSGKVGLFGNEDAFDTIFNMYTEAFPNAEIDAADFNIFTGLKSDTKNYVENLEIYVPEDETEASISLSDVTGIPFAYGSDGSFATSNSNLSTALDAAYFSAFNKELDTGVVSKRRFPVEVLLDAGFSLETKVQMAALGLERGDCQTIIDAGFLTTRYEAYNWADSVAISAIEDWSISKVFQHAVIKDPFTGKSIKVTATYFYAKLLPTHYFVNGRHNAMVGQDYGLCEGIVKEKIYPMVEYDDDEIKTGLVERHLNWIEAIATNTFVIGVQNTSQMANSDMIEMSNAATLLAMKRDLDRLCLSYTYKFGEADDRARYTKDALALLEPYKEMVRSYSVYFDMNPWEEQRSILHCYLSVTFKTIVKNIIVEIDINSRVSTDVTTSAN